MSSPSDSLRVTFLGPLASFSHQAALDLFPASQPTPPTLLPTPSFADALAAVQNNTADYAVVPIENSTNGAVVQVLDLLADRDSRCSDLAVCGEYYLTVHHCLLVRPADAEGVEDPSTLYPRIAKLYTHPQAWGQCDTFLSTHFKGVERQDAPSTSKAAAIVANTPLTNSDELPAAIASPLAATQHSLHILVRNIEDRANNTTRFLILRNKSSTSRAVNSGEGRDFYPHAGPTRKLKALISFTIDHEKPGALVEALNVFRNHGLNLTSIGSRPGQVVAWQYIFFVECEWLRGRNEGEGEGEGEIVERAMVELKGKTGKCRDLGRWGDRLGG
ncbi:hypothetical protein AJ79_06654 [Helicocarpus griseus UAMH5409]|uniref:prephenate dehydratase n=1 Tax=Helicocarpus griseus UAMH5409 TaxID=1447875 RepID=A0A2B7XAF4_9EURO|nr:hypothetical protein AJ79_06654 [Helicocarpus griseus UAMH5409]